MEQSFPFNILQKCDVTMSSKIHHIKEKQVTPHVAKLHLRSTQYSIKLFKFVRECRRHCQSKWKPRWNVQKQFEIFDMMYLNILFGISLYYFIPENILVKPWLFVRSRQNFFNILSFFLFSAVRLLLQVFFLFIPYSSNCPVSVWIVLENSNM